MPGFNQRGPMNEGPMTGRKMGRCFTGSELSDANTSQTHSGAGYGGQGYGGDRFMGGRGCRGFRRRAVMYETAPPLINEDTTATEQLHSQIRKLEIEIETLKNQLQQQNSSM
ncbi:MAG: DUF5320 domain-containing protein [Desulfopila sp.]|nr:DUF5320 domain-containing protein [Desulfopila sp.]